MSELKPCCRHCCYFRNDTCTREPFEVPDDEPVMLYTFINEGYLRKAILKSLNRSDFCFKIFGQIADEDKKTLIDEFVEDIVGNAETIADEFYTSVHTDVLIKDPDNFLCNYYK